MKVKVCGLKYPENIKAIDNLPVDFMGFIFYPKSKRNINEETLNFLKNTNSISERVGVFVDETLGTIISQAKDLKLSYIQLHSNESPEFCKEIMQEGLNPMKAFCISDDFNFKELIFYAPFCRYFLFDTKGKNKGGNGTKFNWNLLKNYNLDTPYFLSGGITPDDAQAIQNLKLQKLEGIDINSGFETAPGLKDVLLVSSFIKNFN